MADEINYYRMLGVPEDADDIAIRLAYRQLARRLHPDVAGEGSLQRMQTLNEAYATLSDPERRRAYDVRLGLSPRAAPVATAPASTRNGTLHTTRGPFTIQATLLASDAVPVASVALAHDARTAALGLLDGRVSVWNVQTRQQTRLLEMGQQRAAGVLQEVVLSPSGRLAAAWGFLLGTRVWHLESGRSLWNTALNAPNALMDAVLLDEPDFIRLALPDAPLAIAADDPFRWAEQGRTSTAIYARPLAAEIEAAWAVPTHCVETTHGGLLQGDPDRAWRVVRRVLAADGHSLLTFSVGALPRRPRGPVLTLWEWERRGQRGMPQAGRRVAQMSEPRDLLAPPLAATPDLAWVAMPIEGQGMRLLSPRGGQPRSIALGPLPPDARAALSADGEYLALAHAARLDLWETRDGRHVQAWQLATEVTALSFSPHAGPPWLALGLRSGVAEVWG